MSTAFLEIIELANGDYVLKHADSDGEPLVNIRFSKETKAYLQENSFDIARLMIQAGIEAVSQMGEEAAKLEALAEEPSEQTLH